MNETPTRRFTGLWLPVSILDARDLTYLQCLLWAEIHALQESETKGCWASNQHLAGVFRVPVKTVKNSLSILVKFGWLRNEPMPNGDRRLFAIVPDSGGGGVPNSGRGVPKTGRGCPEFGTVVYKERIEREQIDISAPGHPVDPEFKLEITSSDRSDRAEEIYSAYPRRVGKPAALKAIRTALKTTPFDVLAEAVGRYALMVLRWPAADRTFVPHPATWFNQRRWEDADTFLPRPAGRGTDSYNAPSTNPDPQKF